MILTADHVINCRSCYTDADHVTDHTNTDYLSSKEHANNTVHIKNQLFYYFLLVLVIYSWIYWWMVYTSIKYNSRALKDGDYYNLYRETLFSPLFWSDWRECKGWPFSEAFEDSK